jgi:type I restriction-modification system DNA methylase subunit
MTLANAFASFLDLVERVHSGRTARSENDLSSKLSTLLETLGLHTVIDTSGSAGGRKRPDILGYVAVERAHLVLSAEIVIESKKPEEVRHFATLAEAMGDLEFWRSKTLPYLRDNIARVQYYAITTFTDCAVVRIDPEIRHSLVVALAQGDMEAPALRQLLQSRAQLFQLAPPTSAEAWLQYLEHHWTPEALEPLPISSILSAIPVETSEGLEEFASQLATFAAGPEDGSEESGLFQSIRNVLAETYDGLNAEVRRDLLVFTMAQHPGLDLGRVEQLIRDDLSTTLDEFVASSIHSLISRFFALKAVEDAFCVGESEPLIEKPRWVFNTTDYDQLPVDDLRREVFARMRALRDSSNALVQRFAAYGFFFDWIEDYIDPILFRSLFEIFASHDFQHVQGDVLGRFYELYAQRINRTRRKELGQYYTPIPIVRFMWWLAASVASKLVNLSNVTVLDPGMGSGTFLAEGARVLAIAGVPDFWRKLTGFDIAAQVMGIAHVNLYMAVLSQLDHRQAREVDDLRLYTTDTLDPRNGQYLKLILPLLTSEEDRRFIEQRIQVSVQVKQPANFHLVIGNPPYRNNSSLTLRQVAQRFPRLLASSDAEAAAQVRNIRDDYAWFFAAADYYVGTQGLICFIVSDSFAWLRSYRYFREALLAQYRVHQVIRLGASVFQDVGPRISFVIIAVEKRATPLPQADDAEPILYTDLRDLADGMRADILGTDGDPRFQELVRLASGQPGAQPQESVQPTRETNFSLYPHTEVVRRVLRNAAPAYAKESSRIFVAKWPGIITAFDTLFKDDTAQALALRMESLFQVAQQKGIDARDLAAAIDEWGERHGFEDDELGRLYHVALQIRQSTLSFDSSRIKRSFSGAMPNSVRWYPPRDHAHFLYYEPTIHIPRKVNVGKAVGWGSMEQWRDPQSHLITPKLIYTTASKPNYGLKAFVVADEWYVKLHGGTSQQFNYTGIHNPLEPASADGRPNNLTDVGLELLRILVGEGLPPTSVLYYVAAVYNSVIAEDFLEEASSNLPFGVHLPQNAIEVDMVATLATQGSKACRLLSVAHALEGQGEVEAAWLEAALPPTAIQDLGFEKHTASHRRFKPTVSYRVPDDLAATVSEWIEGIEDGIDQIAEALYS